MAECHLVTGGGGYAGCHLGKTLHEKGHRVVLFDIREPILDVPSEIIFIKGDITNYEDVEAAFQGADCVYHLASYGMSGREQLSKSLIEKVNITGTKNVVKACQKQNVGRLVYTSTYNVVFGGQKIENGDESLPYWPLDKHPDYYSRTKAVAEVAVLSSNGSTMENGGILHTCALRLAGVYGPGEQRHLPRIVTYIENGLFALTYGEKSSLVDFLHIKNLIEAHFCAGEALSKQRNHLAAGQAYFISDCKPINNFEFFRPLVEGLGYSFPKIRCPLFLVYFIAFVIEVVHSLVGWLYNFQPLLTRTEVYKTGVTHYFSNAKAASELGYYPVVQNDVTDVVQWFLTRGHGRRKLARKSYTCAQLLVDVALIGIIVMLIMSFLPIAR